MLKTTLQSPTEVSPVYGRGEKRLIRNRTEQKSPGRISLHYFLGKMTETDDRQDTTATTEENPQCQNRGRPKYQFDKSRTSRKCEPKYKQR